MADALDRKLQHAAERCNILLKVKLTVDELLASGSHVTWSTYGGLGRICDNVEQALLHGSRIITPVFIKHKSFTREIEFYVVLS